MKNLFCAAIMVVFSASGWAQADAPVIGRWDLTMEKEGVSLPSWLEVRLSGSKTLVGSYVGEVGSARPVAQFHYQDNTLRFSVPPQWVGNQDLEFTARYENDELVGEIIHNNGTKWPVRGVRAPLMIRETPKSWTAPEPIFNGVDLSGWVAQSGPDRNQWIVKDGILTSPKSGSNLMTEQKFNDFKLHIEFRYPAGSNSGIYLRGRHEVQVEDNYGKQPSSTYFGGVYGFLTPNAMAALPAGSWQTYDITLIGRRVTITANGQTIICDQIIPGITGGALDAHEGLPGPILLQGDHGPVEYRNITMSYPEYE